MLLSTAKDISDTVQTRCGILLTRKYKAWSGKEQTTSKLMSHEVLIPSAMTSTTISRQRTLNSHCVRTARTHVLVQDRPLNALRICVLYTMEL